MAPGGHEFSTEVFISYRRADAGGHATHLFAELARRYGRDCVFLDHQTLAPSDSFRACILKAIFGPCRAMVVLIDRRWVSPQPDGRPPRLFDPDDFVRLEVSEALMDPDVAVFPVLADGARMPMSAELPEPLRGIVHLHAAELTGLRWEYDVGQLAAALDRYVRCGRDTPPPPPPPPPWWLAGEGIVVATVAGIVGYALAKPIDAADTEQLSLIAEAVQRRAITWAPVGAALAVWLAVRRRDRSSLIRNVLVGLLLGALAGAVGGGIFAALAIAPDTAPTPEALEWILVAALAAVGAILGAAIGFMWMPRRASIAALAGFVGAVVVQALLNAVDQGGAGTVQVAVRCVAIMGCVLLTLLTLDVRAARARETKVSRPLYG